MIELSLEKTSIVKGEEGKIIIAYDDIKLYTHVNVEIYDAGIPIPTPKFDIGTSAIKNTSGQYEITFKTNDFPLGIYELKLVRLLTITNIFDLIEGNHYKRVFF